MIPEQKIFNDLIETIVNNSENNSVIITNVELWAKSWKEEMKQALTLTDVSQQRELLRFMEWLSTYWGIDEVIDCTKHQNIVEQYKP